LFLVPDVLAKGEWLPSNVFDSWHNCTDGRTPDHWTVTRFRQPHVQMYMFCPYVISTLYHFQKILSHAIHLATLHLSAKRNELRYFITTVFHMVLAFCCSRKIEHYSWCRNASFSRVSSGKRPVDLLPATLLLNLVKVQKEVGS
jgi:hypothetical protein